MNTFFKKFSDEKIAVHCKTEEEAWEFLKYADKAGLHLAFSDELPYKNNNWSLYGEDTAYLCGGKNDILTLSVNKILDNTIPELYGYQVVEASKILNKDFSLPISKLKTGMIVTTRAGSEYTVLLDAGYDVRRGDILVGKKEFLQLSHYNDNLQNCENSKDDIMKIEMQTFPQGIMDLNPQWSQRTVLWEREKSLNKKYIPNEEREKNTNYSELLSSFLDGELIIHIHNENEYIAFMEILYR